MDILDVVSVPVIIVAVYLLLELYKQIFKNNEKAKNFIPIVAGILGIGFGILLYFVYPSMIPAENIVNAIIVGLVSGLGATGTNQIVKQLQKLLEGGNNGTGTE